MAYIGLVNYDDGGRIRSLDGLADVMYDDGASRNLLGADMGAVKYDDGGRFRTLIGLGQDPSLDIPTDLPLAPSSSFIPIEFAPPTPAPIVDTISAPVTGELIPPTPTPVPPTFYQPLVSVDTVNTPMPGSLVGPPAPAGQPSSAGTLVSVAAPAAGALTSIFNGIKSVFSGGSTQVKPITPGTLAPGAVGQSWFSQGTIVSGLPNWGLLAGVGVAGVLLMVSLRGGSSGGSRRRNPGRRRLNPAELLLMGANPRYRRAY